MGDLPEDVKVVFYHIEKCGGSSIRKILYDYFLNIYDKKEIFELSESSIDFRPEYILEIKNNDRIDFNNLKVILSHTHYNHFPLLNPSIKITFIRDPINRAISHYYYFTYKENNIHFIDLPEEEFKIYCSWCCNLMCIELNLLNDDNTLNEDKLNNLLHDFSFIGKLEYFEESLSCLNEILNDYFKKTINIESVKIHEHKDKNVKDLDLLREKLLPFCKNDYILYNKIDKFIYNNPKK